MFWQNESVTTQRKYVRDNKDENIVKLKQNAPWETNNLKY